ncbi:hypothetical protein [Bradyrhizobium sp. USDA 336]|uniref:hypothetical protein n=1 Tax=Bradyrhizobium sp. USDA 336 TaxID=3156311 RepID=UPI003832B460
MIVECKGTARIQHKSTGEIYEIESDELDWDAVSSDERQMGPETEYQAVIDHPALGMLRWSLWEYPVGMENDRETDAQGHKVIKDFEYGLEHEPDLDDWSDYAVPDDPYSEFMASYNETSALLAEKGSDEGHALLNRMIFSHQITAMEAYLADTLLNAVLNDDDAKSRLMSDDKDLNEQKFTISQIAAEPDIVARTIERYLRSILYHNVLKVDFLYSCALQIKILTLVSDKARLLKDIRLRHDCVHRNGFDKDGNELNVFTKDYVQATADLIMDFINKLEAAVRARAV